MKKFITLTENLHSPKTNMLKKYNDEFFERFGNVYEYTDEHTEFWLEKIKEKEKEVCLNFYDFLNRLQNISLSGVSGAISEIQSKLLKDFIKDYENTN